MPTAELAIRPDVNLTETSWTPTGPMDFDEWVDQGRRLGVMGRACQWWIGDWINYGEQAYGEKYAQAVEETGLDVGTLMNYASIAGHIPEPNRVVSLTWSHHREVAYLDAPERDRYLTQAVEQHLPVSKLAQLVKGEQRQVQAGTDHLPTFKTILHIDHPAVDQDGADQWARKLVERLAAQGAIVTYRSTTA